MQSSPRSVRSKLVLWGHQSRRGAQSRWRLHSTVAPAPFPDSAANRRQYSKHPMTTNFPTQQHVSTQNLALQPNRNLHSQTFVVIILRSRFGDCGWRLEHRIERHTHQTEVGRVPEYAHGRVLASSKRVACLMHHRPAQAAPVEQAPTGQCQTSKKGTENNRSIGTWLLPFTLLDSSLSDSPSDSRFRFLDLVAGAPAESADSAGAAGEGTARYNRSLRQNK
jgi:hypothetical protein